MSSQLTRRAHNKSRAGCRNCKRRRIKCDEKKPSCEQCARFRVACDYVASTRQETSISNANSPAQRSNEDSEDSSYKRPRGRPRKNWDPLPSTSSTPASSCTISAGTEEDQSSDAISLNVQDIELSLHFANHTAPSLGEHGIMAQVWKEKIPQLGLSHPFLLHLLLSLSAFHLARRQPERRDSLRSMAEDHATAGLRGNTIALASITPENRQAVYMSAVLACYIHLARGPTPDDCLLFKTSGQGPADWFTMFRALRLLHGIFGDAIGFSVYFKETTHDEATEAPSPTAEPAAFCPDGWQEALQELQKHISSDSGNDSPDLSCQKAIESLLQTYDDAFSGTKNDALPVFAWLHMLEDDFVQQAQQLRPIPLILLAYFAIAKIPLEKNWFLEGWSSQIIHTVQKQVPPEHQKWLQWPLIQWAKSRAVVSES